MGLLELSLPEVHLAAALSDHAEDQRVGDRGLDVETLKNLDSYFMLSNLYLALLQAQFHAHCSIK